MAFRNKNTGIVKCTGYFYEGKEIVLTKQVGIPIKKDRHNMKWWPDAKKIEAATLYAVLRDFKEVQKLTGIPWKVVESWTVEPWWAETINKCLKLRNEELDGKITIALDKSLDILLDRLEHGEIYIDRKTKSPYRVPMSTKAVTLAADIFFDKRQLIRGEATTRTESITQEQRLLALKDQFEKLARSKGINLISEPIEGEVIHELRDGQIEGATPVGGENSIDQSTGESGREDRERDGSEREEWQDGISLRTGTGTSTG